MPKLVASEAKGVGVEPPAAVAAVTTEFQAITRGFHKLAGLEEHLGAKNMALDSAQRANSRPRASHVLRQYVCLVRTLSLHVLPRCVCA